MKLVLNWGLGKHMWDVPLKHLTPHFLKVRQFLGDNEEVTQILTRPDGIA